MSVMTARARGFWLLRVWVVGCALVSFLYFLRTAFPLAPIEFDDAYMFLRYAKHFLSGHGFSWNVNDGPAYGATSTLYMFTITTLRGLTSISDSTVLSTVSVSSALASCGLLVALGFLVLRDGALRRSWMPIAMVPLIVLSPLFRFHGLSGMETTLSLLCNSVLAIAVVMFVKARSRSILFVVVLAAYLSYLARPDNGVYCLLFPPLFFVASDRPLRKSAMTYIVLFAIVVAADMLVKKQLLGDSLPLPFFAKQAGFYQGYLGTAKWNPVAFTLDFMTDCVPFLVLIVWFADTTTAPKLAATLLPLVVTFGYYLKVNQIMGYGARYYYPFKIFVVLAALIAVSESGRRIAPKVTPFVPSNPALRLMLVSALLVITISPIGAGAAHLWQARVVGQPERYVARRQYVAPIPTPLPSIGWWPCILEMTALLRQMPTGTVAAASEYGLMGSELPDIAIVDVLGLQDRHVAHNGFSAEYLFSKKPDVIWFPHPDYSYAIKEILDSPAFPDEYEYFPGAFDYGIALRKRSSRLPSIKQLVQRAFSRVYQGRELPDYQAVALPSGGNGR